MEPGKMQETAYEIDPDLQDCANISCNTNNDHKEIKLNQIVQEFSNLNEEMQIRAKQQREKKESRILKLENKLDQLQEKHMLEVQKRVELNVSLQNSCTQMINEMINRFETQVEEHMRQVHEQLEKLSLDLASTQQIIAEQKASIPLATEQKTKDLTAQLLDFMESIDAEQQRRSEQEESISERLASLEYSTNTFFAKEREDRELKLSVLRQSIENFHSDRKKGDEKFSSFTREEFHRIQNAIQLEARARECEDVEIIKTLHVHSASLQRSLQVIHS